jgi:hypothetical protein
MLKPKKPVKKPVTKPVKKPVKDTGFPPIDESKLPSLSKGGKVVKKMQKMSKGGSTKKK